MNREVKRELQEAMDRLLEQRRLRAEARERLTDAVRAEYTRRGVAATAGDVKATVDARMGKEWDTNGRTLDYVNARDDVVAWGILAVYDLLVDVRRDQVQRDAARRRSY